jgi:hypothetical protein
VAYSSATIVSGSGFITVDVTATADNEGVSPFAITHGVLAATQRSQPANTVYQAHPGWDTIGNPYVTWVANTAKGLTGSWEVYLQGFSLMVKKRSTAVGSGDGAAQIRVMVMSKEPDSPETG